MPAAFLVESPPVNRTCQPPTLVLLRALVLGPACSAVPSAAPAQHPAPTPAPSPAPAAAPAAKAQWSGQVAGVSDGDTLQVMREGKAIKVRLFGVDTPADIRWLYEEPYAFLQVPARRFAAAAAAAPSLTPRLGLLEIG